MKSPVSTVPLKRVCVRLCLMQCFLNSALRAELYSPYVRGRPLQPLAPPHRPPLSFRGVGGQRAGCERDGRDRLKTRSTDSASG